MTTVHAQYVKTSAGGAGSGNIPVGSSVSSGQTVLVVTISNRSTPRTISSVTGLGGTFTEILNVGTSRLTVWKATNCSGTGNIVVTFSGTQSAATSVIVCSGETGTTITGSATTDTDTEVLGPSDSAGIGQLVVNVASLGGSPYTYPDAPSPATGWNSVNDSPSGAFSAYRLPATTASHQLTGTRSTSIGTRLDMGQIVYGDISSVDATVDAPAATATAAALVPTVAVSAQEIAAPAATATAAALVPTISTQPRYTVDLRLGALEFLISLGVCDLGDDVLILDGLNVAWQINESDPWPAQPQPVTARLNLFTGDNSTLDSIVVGTPISFVVTNEASNTIATFDGRVAAMTAAPHTASTGRGTVWIIDAVDYTVDLAETPVILTADLPAQSADERMAAIVTLIAAAGGPTVLVPADTADCAFEAYAAGTYTAAALLDDHLRQITIPGDGGPERYFVVPDAGVFGSPSFTCSLVPRVADASALPYLLELVEGVLTLTPDPDTTANIDACQLAKAMSWTRLKFRAVNTVTVTAEAGTVTASNPGPPVRLTLNSTLTDLDALERMAELYLPDVDENNGWVADSFQLNGHNTPDALAPAWFPDHTAPADATEVYVRGHAVVGIAPEWNLSGETVYAGQLVKVSLTIARGEIPVSFAFRRQLPSPTGDGVITWDDLKAEFPAVTWDEIDPAVSWYELRLARLE